MTDLSTLAPAAQAKHLFNEWAQCQPHAPLPSPELLAQLTALCQLIHERKPENINVDTEDIRSTILDATAFALASAVATGPQRASQVAHAVLASLPLPLPLLPSGRLLLAISSAHTAELEMDELMEIVETIQEHCGPETEMIFGHGEHELTEGVELRIWLLVGIHNAPKPLAFPTPLTVCSAPSTSNPDPAFIEAAHLIVRHGYGSTALLQRHLRTGYNRTGRLLEQLLQAGIVAQPTAPKSRYYPALVTSETQVLALLAQLSSQS